MKSDSRFLLLGGVALTRGRIKNAGPALVAVCDEMDLELRSCGFVEQAPFQRIDGIIRFGRKNAETPELGPIKDGGLPFAIEVEMAPLCRAVPDTVRSAFRLASLKSLIHIGRVYGLPIENLERLRAELEH